MLKLHSLPGVLALSLLFALPAAAQEKESEPKPQAQTRIDARAKAALDAMPAAYKKLNALHVRYSSKIEGSPEPFSFAPRSLEMRYQKPNRIRLEYTMEVNGKPRRTMIVSDGKTLWSWDSLSNQYAKRQAPAAFKSSDFPDSPGPEFEYLFGGENPFESFPPGINVSIGEEKSGATTLDAVKMEGAFGQEKFEVVLLLDRSDRMIRGMRMTISNAPDKTAALQMTYSLFNPSPAFTAADFKFTPPAGAKPKP
jgi:outer membrane lipoprotein-sorting protein